MNIDPTRAKRKLIAIHGKAIVARYLPMVAKRGFTYICEISHGDTVEEYSVGDWTGLRITRPEGTPSFNPMFSFNNQRLWEVAAGYETKKDSGSAVTIMNSKYPGKVTLDSGAQAGSFIARLIGARLHGRVHISSDGTKTTDEDILWDYASKK